MTSRTDLMKIICKQNHSKTSKAFYTTAIASLYVFSIGESLICLIMLGVLFIIGIYLIVLIWSNRLSKHRYKDIIMKLIYTMAILAVGIVILILLISIPSPPPPPPPGYIEVEPTVITTGVPTTVTVWVPDTNGKPFQGATVTIEGCGVAEAGTTGSDGKAVFNITAELPPNAIYGSLTVTVRGGDPEVTKTATIVVMKSTT